MSDVSQKREAHAAARVVSNTTEVESLPQVNTGRDALVKHEPERADSAEAPRDVDDRGYSVSSKTKDTEFSLVAYFVAIKRGKMVLWCYLIWYSVTVFNHFDASAVLWLNSLGISAVIGVALLLSVGTGNFRNVERWQVFRLFLMPFCVSSFSSLIKGQGYILVFPAHLSELAVASAACAAFVIAVATLKWCSRRASARLA